MNIKIVVINLDRAPERLERFTSSAQKHGIVFERFSAIDKYDTNRIEELRKEYKMCLAPQHSACALSHLKVLEDFVESNFDYCIIFEDDAKITHGGFTDIDQLIKDTKSERVDMIYINNRIRSDSTHRITRGCGLESYIVSKEGARKLLSNKYNMNQPIDFWFQASTHFYKTTNHAWRKNFEIKDVCVYAYKSTRPYTTHIDLGKSYLNGK